MSEQQAGPFPNRFNFDYFTYPKEEHFRIFKEAGYDVAMNKHYMNPSTMSVKDYEDMLVVSFILNNIPVGGKILDVGGGQSRTINLLKKLGYECWNLDKFEGKDGGYTFDKLSEEDKKDCRFIFDYIGNFSPELPDKYFDCVYSISVMEHIALAKIEGYKLIADLNRVTKKDGYNLHCIDFFVKDGKSNYVNKIIDFLFKNTKSLNQYIEPKEIVKKPDLWIESEETFYKILYAMCKEQAFEWGRTTCISILWQ